jgi:hypothetical protein
MHAIGHADYMLKSNLIIRLDYHDYIYTEIIVQYYRSWGVLCYSLQTLQCKKIVRVNNWGEKTIYIMLYVEYEHE